MVVMQFLIVPVLLLQMIMRNPDSGLAIGLSLFPFFTPILMFVRIIVHQNGDLPVRIQANTERKFHSPDTIRSYSNWLRSCHT